MGSVTRDASRRLCYEMSDMPAGEYRNLCKLLAKEFGLWKLGYTVTTDDAVFCTYFRWFCRVSIEWDNWSGFMIVAKNNRSKQLVMRMGKFLESHRQEFSTLRASVTVV